jgi:alkenylglycerophosphocholine/alkenylglycerophosphoethanolamine hydrolase
VEIASLLVSIRRTVSRAAYSTSGLAMTIWEEHMVLWLILALICAALEIFAVSKDLQRLEYFAKPAVMICLLLWLYSSTDLQGNAFWFGLGILFSLMGDVLLMISLDKMFLLGLFAFLLAHISYVTGFREEIVTVTAWSLILAVFIAINVGRLLRRIVGAILAKGQNKLVIPVIAYGTVISVMLYAAMSTIYNPTWKTNASFFVSLGAFLFCTSDAILAWNKFVAPIKNGRAWNISLYYLGQIGLIAGVIAQFG